MASPLHNLISFIFFFFLIFFPAGTTCASLSTKKHQEEKFIQIPTIIKKLGKEQLVALEAEGEPINLYFEGEPYVEYFIEVKSINIDRKTIPINTSLLSIHDKNGIPFGGTKIINIIQYTTLHRSIYEPFVEEFVNKCLDKNITKVASVAPFGACFISDSIGSSREGPRVPIIDIAVQGSNEKWKIYGDKSMVKVDEDVWCLGFVDGGLKARTPIVIGGYQLKGNPLVFDMRANFSEEI